MSSSDPDIATETPTIATAKKKSSPVLPLFLIAMLVGVVALLFVYTAGWLSPNRITPQKLVTALAPPGGPTLGHRRSHILGICFTGDFKANGAGTALSTAQVFTPGSYPVVGRFNLPGSDIHMPDAMSQARAMSFRIVTPSGQDWRSAMLDAPTFAARTPEDFYRFLTAAGSKKPNDVEAYLGAHPETLAFVTWAGSR